MSSEPDWKAKYEELLKKFNDFKAGVMSAGLQLQVYGNNAKAE